MKKILFLFMIGFVLPLLVGCTGNNGNSYTNPVVHSGSDTSSGNEYNEIVENPYQDALSTPLSTFSIDVDTASYSNVRQYIQNNQLPPTDAIRLEELVNYFNYDYTSPTNGDPMSIVTEVAPCPWNHDHQLAMIALKGIDIHPEDFPASNLVFLIDVSGSMADSNKLPLVKASLSLLVEQLRSKDRISIVTYSNSASVKLQAASIDNKEMILNVIDSLSANGSTSGAAGIQKAYEVASRYFIEDGNNRVVLTTDGDFNVGITEQDELKSFIESKQELGIYLSVLGFGIGNLQDDNLETLASYGNGNYGYIDTMSEAKKIFLEQLAGTLLTIAKDVKIQVEFNPGIIKAYRLLGYEHRLLNEGDFTDDETDAGDIGAGFVVTAFYELVPTSSTEDIPNVDDAAYQNVEFENLDQLMMVNLRYKEIDAVESTLRSQIVYVSDMTDHPSINFEFASSVAEFGLLLLNSEFKGDANWDNVKTRAITSKGIDEEGYRTEFIQLVELAKNLSLEQDND